jgi:hypothetical protein
MSAGVSQVPSPLAFLCAELRVSEAQLLQLPLDFLNEKIKKSNQTGAEQAAAFIALAAAAPKSKSIAEYYAEKDERTTYPWKIAENRASIQLGHLAAQFAEPNPFEPLKKIFLAQAKAQQLAPIENVVLQYLLFSKNPDLARFTLANLLLTIPPAARLSVHNWAVAAGMSRARREAYGHAIENCAWPLFPDEEDLMTLNSRLLVAVAVPALEGVAATATDNGVYAKKSAEQFWGGGSLPILTSENGTFLETGPLEAALAHLGGQISTLQTQFANRGRTTSGYGQPQGYHQRRGRGEGGRGRGRGFRSRGRGYYGAGGDDGTAEDESPKNGATQ